MRNYMQTQKVFGMLMAAVLFTVASTVIADDISWDQAVDGTFQDSANWDPEQVPASGDTGFFELDSSGYTVTLDSDVTTGLVVDNDEVTLDLGGYTFTNESAAWAGVDNAIDLTVTNGTLQSTVTNRLFRNSGASGTLTFTGAGTTWNTGTGGDVGGTQLVREGTGTVAINNGATVNAQTGGGMFDLGAGSGSDGTLNIDGSGSKWDGTNTALGTGERFRLTNNSGAEANINVTNGGVFHHRGQLRSGGGDSRATISGTGSLMKTDDRLLINNETANSSEEFLVQDGGSLVALDENAEGSQLQDGQFGIEGDGSSIEIGGDFEFSRGNLRVQLEDAMASDTLMTVGGDLNFADAGSYSNDFILELASGFDTTVGTVFDVIDFTGDRTGDGVFDNLTDGSTISIDGYEFLADYGNTSNSTFSLEVTQIPEPSTLFLLGLAGLLLMKRRRVR